MKEHEHIRVDVAGIVFSITSAQDKKNIQIEKSYRSFLSTAPPEIFINVYYDYSTQFFLQDNDMIFDSEGPWSLYRINGKNAIVFGDPVAGSLLSRVALFDNNMRQVELYVETEHLQNGLVPDPLQYPLAEILMVCLLAKGRGLMVHACGINDKGRGYLFAGNSTHGKTTMAKLWKKQTTILNDDRIVLRFKEGRFWMYGTPWHGAYKGVSSDGIPIDKIFFIRHAKSNSVQRYKGTNAVSMLLTRSFPPLWDAEGMQFTLDFCASLVETIPCYELGFVPDKNIIDFVRCVK